MRLFGLTMKRQMPGLYLGDIVRAERQDTNPPAWKFDMKCRRMVSELPYIEYSPEGTWMPIGTWTSLNMGMLAASRIQAGTHFYDMKLNALRTFDETVYEELREYQ